MNWTSKARASQIQTQLKNERLRYDDFYNSISLGYCLLERSGRIIDANLRLAEQLGVEKRLLIGTRFDDYIIQEDLNLRYTLKKHSEKIVQRIETQLISKTLSQNFVHVEYSRAW